MTRSSSTSIRRSSPAWHRTPGVKSGYAELAPDLVVEVLSPSDRPGAVLAKVADWLDAGTSVVWVIDPDRRVARVHRSDGSVATVNAMDELLGEAVLPGYAVVLATLLGHEQPTAP